MMSRPSELRLPEGTQNDGQREGTVGEGWAGNPAIPEDDAVSPRPCHLAGATQTAQKQIRKRGSTDTRVSI